MDKKRSFAFDIGKGILEGIRDDVDWDEVERLVEVAKQTGCIGEIEIREPCQPRQEEPITIELCEECYRKLKGALYGEAAQPETGD